MCISAHECNAKVIFESGRKSHGNCAGIITTIISDDEEDKLKEVAEKLKLQMVSEEALAGGIMPDPEADIDSAKKELEDLYNLM